MFQNFSWCPTFAKNREIPKVSFAKVSSFKVINCLENINRINIIIINSATLLKKIFDSEPVYNEKNLKIKIQSQWEKSTQTFMVICYQREVFNAFVYQQFGLTLFLKWVETIILRCFQKSLNTLLRKKKVTRHITENLKTLSKVDKMNLMKNNLTLINA